MGNKLWVILLASIISHVVPVFALSVGVAWEHAGEGIVSSSWTCRLDKPMSFEMQAFLKGGLLSEKSQANGFGNNVLKNRIFGDGYSVENGLTSSGSLSASSSGVGSAKCGIYTQNVAISGGPGSITSSSNSKGNSVTVAGGYSANEGNLNAQLTSAASDKAVTSGKASIMGVDCFDDQTSQNVASGNIVMNLNGLYANQDGTLGDFGLIATNYETGKSPFTSQVTDSRVSSENLNDPHSYKLEGWRWQDNPDIQLYLKVDDSLQNAGLAIDQVYDATHNAAQTWDGVTSQKLFKNGVIFSPSLSADTFDNKNVITWMPIHSSLLAYTRTYYDLSNEVTGYNQVSYYKTLESDIVFNTEYNWATDGRSHPLYPNTYDVQTVALHELGHTIGLNDIYDTNFSWDTAQIMNSYDDLQRTLGSGDITGVKQLYGP